MSTLAALEPGQTPQPGHFPSNELSSELDAAFGKFSFWMQTDGNVVLYFGQDSNDRPDEPPAASDARWATHTGPGQFTPSGLIMQTDGNLVLYDTSNQARWASGTSNNPGAYLKMQDDGNVVIYRAGPALRTTPCGQQTRCGSQGTTWAKAASHRPTTASRAASIPARPCRTRWAAYRLSAPAP